MKYIKQLDSLRAMAVIFVIISHWVKQNETLNRIPLGATGVDIFFVLSGFLISKILFNAREKSEITASPKKILLKNFYVRRTLRIFPIYYITIILLLLFAESTHTDIATAFGYYLTYTSNFYFFLKQDWDGMLSHLWSLSVEEQFYLIWPWVIMFINKKYFLHVITFFICIGILSQHLLRFNYMGGVLPFACFDAFGIGALLAWLITYEPGKLKKFYVAASVLSAIAVCLYFLRIYDNRFTIVPLRTIDSFIGLWLVTYVILHVPTKSYKMKFLLDNRVLIYLGKISYGLYLYHLMIPSLLDAKILSKSINPFISSHLNLKNWSILYLVEGTILLLLIATLSYYLIEKRFLKIKHKFEYPRQNIVLP